MIEPFIHLRIHSEYSLVDGLVTIPSLMSKLTQQNVPAVAITDHCNLYATVKFYQAAHQSGIKPIIGVDLFVLDETTNDVHALTLYCQNMMGYKNLLQLISKAYLKGQTLSQPRVKKAWIIEHSDGLIALSGAQQGEIGRALLRQDHQSLTRAIAFFQAHFPERFYLEISRVGRPDEHQYISLALELSQKHSLPIVATNDVRYLEPDDFEAHEARVCIQESSILNDPHRTRHYTDQQFLRSPQEMQQLFSDLPEALANSIEIAKRCNVTFKLGKSKLPHFTVPSNYTTVTYLNAIAKDGLEERLKKNYQEKNLMVELRNVYDQRLERELECINKMGFAGYFLIVADFTKWAKEHAIPVGPGRGSGCGSLVAYALNITDLDPIPFDLIFERFLNPERVSMPDFDIDFCMEGRDRVIQYVIDRHGQECVAQIITYGTMAAKAVVRDVGRVLGLSYGYVDKIAKLIPFELGMTLNKAMKQEPLLRERYEQEEDVRLLMDLAKKLEGLTRNVGKHAGGIVIAPGKLTDYVPLYCEQDQAAHPVTQFDKDDVEAVGLVKFDFLGLKTLTIIDRAMRIVNDNITTQDHKVDITAIPLNDADTFALLKACKTTAVFQLESPGMRDLIKRLEPDCFEELIALVALFRPGPLQAGAADDFINRKHGREKVSYADPRLEPILDPTYGTIVYQEQVMKIAQVLAGYTLGGADILRKAMGKKKPQEMAKQRKIFCEGAMARNVNPRVATQIFDAMEKFAGYGFNKSHSAPYALIAYQTAWLKVHYPAAFMAAVLSSDMDRTDKVIIMLEECKAMGLEVIPPDINNSDYYFTLINDKQIRYGLGAIKGVGLAAIENIIHARKTLNFKDLFDFCERVDLRKVNRRVIEALIKSGCFDSLCKNRASYLESLNDALQFAEQMMQNRIYGQHDLLAIHTTVAPPKLIAAKPWNEEVRLVNEKNTLGFYLTGHPVRRLLPELKFITTCSVCDLETNANQMVKVAGIIANIRMRRTKRGDRFAILTIDDSSGQCEVVCFAEIFNKYRQILNEDQIIVAEGEVNFDDFNNSWRVICKEILTLEQARSRAAKELKIELNVGQTINLEDFKEVISSHLGGSCPISFEYISNNAKAQVKLGKQWLVKPTEDLINVLMERLKVKSAVFVY